jgi:hypothetical protein
MAYLFSAGSSQYLSTTASNVSGSPMTIACWSKTSTTAVGDEVFLAVGASNGNRNTLGRNTANIGAGSNGSNGNFSATLLGSPLTTNTWFHIAGVFASTSSRELFFNGSSGATNSSNAGTQAAFTETLIGARRAASIGLYYTGDIAEVGIWNAALTAAEIASLAKGMTCDKVRPESLVFYAPLVRDLQDISGGLTITNNNAATVATHPRVYA